MVPVPRLLATCERLIELFAEHGYEGSVIFGHAKDGNVHFLLNERFDDPDSVARYRRFTDDLVELVLSPAGRSRPSTAPVASWRRSSGGSMATSSPT